MKNKIHTFTIKLWKKSFFLIPILLLLFFLKGFCSEYFYLDKLHNEIVNTPEKHPSEVNEIYMDVYNGFEQNTVLEYSVRTGISQGLVFPAIILYILLLVTLLTSPNDTLRVFGITLIIITLTCLAIWIYFINNLNFVF